MGNMDVGHQHVVIAETRHAPAKGRRPVDRHVFTENVVIADPDEGFFPLILEMLRGRAQRDERMDLAVLSNIRPPFNDDVRVNAAPLSNTHVLSDNAIGSHRHPFGQFGLPMHNSCRMHAARAHGSPSGVAVPSVIIAMNSASHTRVFSTYASPRIFQ